MNELEAEAALDSIGMARMRMRMVRGSDEVPRAPRTCVLVVE